MSDLVVRNSGMVPLAEVEYTINEIMGRGDKETLLAGAREADVRALYEQRHGARERASYFLQIKILAEAALGEIDVRNHPFGFGKNGQAMDNPMVINGQTIPVGTRSYWRLLGQGRLQGMLSPLLAEHVDVDGLSTKAIACELRVRGVGYVDARVLADAIKGYCQREGISQRELAERIETHPAQISRWLRGRQTIRWERAAQLAELIGLPLSKLKPRAQKRPNRRTQRSRSRLGRPRVLRGGRWDKAYSTHRRTMEEVFALTGEAGEPDLWRLLHALEDALKRHL